MAKAKKEQKQAEIDLDPLYPIRGGRPIDRNLRPGEGGEIFANDSIVAEIGLTYRAFWHIWESVEQTALRMYPKYIDQKPDIANTWLDALVWCRSVALRSANFGEGEIVRISEAEARKIRGVKPVAATKKIPAKITKVTLKILCPEEDCGSDNVIKSNFKGQPKWKCEECGFRWPREVAGAPQEAPEPDPSTKEPKKGKKKQDKAQKKKSKKKEKKK